MRFSRLLKLIWQNHWMFIKSISRNKSFDTLKPSDLLCWRDWWRKAEFAGKSWLLPSLTSVAHPWRSLGAVLLPKWLMGGTIRVPEQDCQSKIIQLATLDGYAELRILLLYLVLSRTTYQSNEGKETMAGAAQYHVLWNSETKTNGQVNYSASRRRSNSKRTIRLFQK